MCWFYDLRIVFDSLRIGEVSSCTCHHAYAEVTLFPLLFLLFQDPLPALFACTKLAGVPRFIVAHKAVFKSPLGGIRCAFRVELVGPYKLIFRFRRGGTRLCLHDKAT